MLAAGCGGSGKFATRGRVLKDGAPLQVAADDTVRVMLVPLPEDGGRAMDYYMAQFYADDATFQVKGKDGQGVPPGKYRVSVEHLKGRKDVFKGAFDSDRSPFVVTIQNASDEIIVDVGKVDVGRGK